MADHQSHKSARVGLASARSTSLTNRIMTSLLACMATVVLVLATLAPPAQAQSEFFDEVALALENKGYFVEDGADGTNASFADLVDWAQDRSGERWYFASLAEPVDQGFADDLRDAIVPQGNVLLFFYDSDDFVYAELASDESEATEQRALETIDGDWATVEEFMRGVVEEVGGVSGSVGSGSGSATTGAGGSSSSGFNPLWLGVPVVGVGGGLWWSSRRRKQEAAAAERENAEKIRAEVQTELDELANDVLVLASPVDLSDNTKAVQYYRDATQAYSEISDLLPDPAELETANLAELSDLGARIVHARWQMDAAEALMDGEPIPEKPQVEPPPAPAKPPTTEQPSRPQMPQRQPRPRRPYSRSRRGSSGGALLDILIAGAGAMGRGTRYGGTYGPASTRGGGLGGSFGGSFGSGSRQRQPTRSRPRSGGGVFGGGTGRSSRSRRSSTRSSGRSSGRSRSTRSRSSSTRRRSSRRRR